MSARLMLIGSLMLGGLLMLASCQDPDGTRDVLDAAGYGDVHIIPNPGWFTACGEHDLYATHFSAKGPTGVPVEGVVCAGGRSGKGATIRITRVIRAIAGPAAPQSAEH